MTKFIAAAVQMDSQDDKNANLAAAEGYIRERPPGEPVWWCCRNP